MKVYTIGRAIVKPIARLLFRVRFPLPIRI